MFGRLWFYRRRRVLPFLAVGCLVFINGATLVPLVPPEAQASTVPSSAAGAGAGTRTDAWHRLNYERGAGDTEPETVVAAALPPVVKNLRRPAPSRHLMAASWWSDRPAPDARGTKADCPRHAWPANGADLSRLCRRLL